MEGAPASERETDRRLADAVRHRLGLVPDLTEARFDSTGWTYEGSCADVRCPTCGGTPLEVWRKPWNPHEPGWRDWCIVCAACETGVGIQALSKWFGNKLRDWNADSSPAAAPIETRASRDSQVKIRFSQPTAGTDVASGEAFESTLHRLNAARVIQDAERTVFVAESGEVVAEWPTSLIVSVDWNEGRATQANSFEPDIAALAEQSRPNIRVKKELERWRSGLARARNVRSSSIISNRAIDEIAISLPKSRDALRSIEFSAVSDLNRIGDDLVRIVRDAVSEPDSSRVETGFVRNQQAPEEPGQTVAQAVQARFKTQVSVGVPRFSKPGWFYVGQAGAGCPRCGGPTEGFRAPYATSAGVRYHYWAVVCLRCGVAFEPRDLEGAARQTLYEGSALRPHAVSEDPPPDQSPG
jgi:hypothetical protein